MTEQVQKDEAIHCPKPASPIFDQYSSRYREFGSRFYDFFKHDLKNYHNAILMSLDMYQLKHEEKYLDMISEASCKSLEHIDRLSGIEPHVFNGGKFCFYSCVAAIRKAAASYSSIDYEITGEDCRVFSDISFPFIFESLFTGIFRSGQTIEKLTFCLSLFEENGFPKCRIDIIFPGLSLPAELTDWILNNENHRFTSNPVHMAFYVAQEIADRYSGDLVLTERAKDRMVFTLTLYQESDSLKK